MAWGRYTHTHTHTHTYSVHPSMYCARATSVQVTSWDLLVALSLTLLAIGWFFFTRPPAGAMNSFFPRGSYGERDAAGETKTSTSTPRGLTANRVSYHAPTPTKALTGPSSGEVERAQVRGASASTPPPHGLSSTRASTRALMSRRTLRVRWNSSTSPTPSASS